MKIVNLFTIALAVTALSIVASSCNKEEERREERREERMEKLDEKNQMKQPEQRSSETTQPSRS